MAVFYAVSSCGCCRCVRVIAMESAGRVCWVLQNRGENKVIFTMWGQYNGNMDNETVINYTEASVLLDYSKY